MAATASAFQIPQDSEKENPRHNMPLKEKIMTGKSNVLQPLGASTKGIIGGGGGGSGIVVVGNQQLGNVVGGVRGGVSLKQGRANFAVLNSNVNVRAAAAVNTHHHNNNNNNNNNHIHPGAGNNKVTLGKKQKDDQITALASKKSTVVPVEQFKTFSVYEDQNENVEQKTQPKQQQQQQQQKQKLLVVTSKQTTAAVTAAIEIEKSTQDVVDKENVFRELQHQRLQQQQPQDILTERSIHNYEHEYVLDTTPMSVSEVLSPMSVDRSANGSQLFDDSNSKEIADIASDRIKLPRNDRQRFFEVVEYQRCILEYFRESEKKHRPKPHYMRRQTDINYSMRTILVDWLVEVSEEYKLDTETLYLSVSYIDRFLSHMSVVRNKLQLVGTAAMYIASKYEEIYPPDVAEFVFITDDTYNKAQVLRMEQIILKILAFDLCTPTAYVFINTYAVLIDVPDKVKYLTLYISELSLLEADPYLRFYPSIISAASLALARYLCDMPVWSPELEEITTYRLEDLKEVFLCLCKSHNAAVNLPQQAVQEKYRSGKFRQVSTIPPASIPEEKFDEIVTQYNELIAEEQKNKDPASENGNGSGGEKVDAVAASSAKVNLFFKF